MCGRYRLSRRKQIIEEYFDSAPWDEDWTPRFNVAPTQAVPVVRHNPSKHVHELSMMKWGLIPHWAKHPSIATGTIKVGNGGDEACFPRSAEIPQMFDSGRRLLRVEAHRNEQTALTMIRDMGHRLGNNAVVMTDSRKGLP